LPTVYHNIGVYFKKTSVKKDSALYYFEVEIQTAKALGREVDLIGAYTEKAKLLIEQQQYLAAEKLLLQALPLTHKYKDPDHLISVPELLGKVYTQTGRYAQANQILKKALNMPEIKPMPDKIRAICGGIFNNYKAQGDYKNALLYLEKTTILKDSLYNEKITQIIEETSAKYETEKKEAQIKTLETEKTLRNYSIIALILLGLGLSWAMWNRLKVASLAKELDKQKAIVQQENLEKLQLEIQYKQRELSSAALYLDQRNEFLNDLKTLIKDGEGSKKLLTEIDKNTNLANEWEKFKIHFDQVHPSFFEALLQQVPNLTDLEQKQCAYIKLNLSPKQVANLLNVTPHAVSTSRTRIKKKFDIEEDSSLSDFLNGLS
jgi:DNA-binding CsgD family transcriptional regulator